MMSDKIKKIKWLILPIAAIFAIVMVFGLSACKPSDDDDVSQLVEITSISRRRAQIEDKIAVYRTQTENAQNTLDYYKSYEGLLDKAYEYGFVFGK